MDRWTFLTNHSHVLVCIVRDPEIRLRDVAAQVGITERAAQRIVADLVEGGYLSSTKVGRRNRYNVHANLPLRHPVESSGTLRKLLESLTEAGKSRVESNDRRTPQRRLTDQVGSSRS